MLGALALCLMLDNDLFHGFGDAGMIIKRGPDMVYTQVPCYELGYRVQS